MKHLLLFENYNPLYEYLQQEEQWLYKYLKSDDETKYIGLAYNHEYKLEDFIEDIDNGLDELMDTDDAAKLLQMLADETIENYEVFDMFGDNKKFMEAFGRYIENVIDNSELTTPFFLEWPEIIKNQWLMHQTDDASEIWKEGFKYGTQEMEELGLTTYRGKESKKYGGYDFAYTPADFDKYGTGSRNNTNGLKYGSEAILFRSSGVRAWHHGDEEYQTIFWGPHAEDIIWIEYGDDGWFIESRKTGEILVTKEDIIDLVEWVDTNYAQYRKHLEFKS